MYPRNIRVESPEEALIAEQALAMYREMRQAATSAPMVRYCRWPSRWRWRVVVNSPGEVWRRCFRRRS